MDVPYVIPVEGEKPVTNKIPVIRYGCEVNRDIQRSHNTKTLRFKRIPCDLVSVDQHDQNLPPLILK